MPDPGWQLCTDDFEGPSPHNSNLALKGVLALGAYARDFIAPMDKKLGAEYVQVARAYLRFWAAKAGVKGTSDKQSVTAQYQSHYRLQYNTNDTSWSTLYNGFWLFALGLHKASDVFPTSEYFVNSPLDGAQLQFYQAQLSKSGMGYRLDSRGNLAKNDWQMWAAAVEPVAKGASLNASADASFFAAAVDGIHAFAHRTPDRTPLTDYYDVETGKNLGFRARPVVGGFWARALLQLKARRVEEDVGKESVGGENVKKKIKMRKDNNSVKENETSIGGGDINTILFT